jgi:hypothetical protein
MSSQIDERLHETSDVIVARVPLHVFWVHQKSEKSETFKPCYLDHIREAPNVRHFQLAAVKSTAPTTAVGKSQKGKKKKEEKKRLGKPLRERTELQGSTVLIQLTSVLVKCNIVNSKNIK